jgi:hypothetical protein
MNRLFLIEFYTNSPTGTPGWEINLAWVHAESQAAAKAKLMEQQGARLDCVITVAEHSSIVPLDGTRVNGPEANLFTLP